MTELVRKTLNLLTPKDRWEGLALLTVMIFVAVVETAGIASILPFMAVVTNTDTIVSNRWLLLAYESFGFTSQTKFLQFLGLIVVGLLVVSNLLKALNTWLVLRYHNRLNYALARRLLAQYMARPYDFFLNRNTAELGKNILNEAVNVVSGVIDPLTNLVSRSLIALAILILLVAVDPVVAIAIALVLAGTYGAIYWFARRKLHSIGRQQIEANIQKFKSAGEALSGIKEIKVLGRERTFLLRFVHYAKRHADNNVTAGMIAEMPRYALEVVAFGGILLVVLYLLGLGNQGSGTVPVLALYAFAGYRLLPALQQLFAASARLRQSIPALELLHRDLQPSDHERRSAERLLDDIASAPALPFSSAIELRNVDFRYEGAAEPALKRLNLIISANTSVGLVGPTGCGKSTTADLLLGLLTPTTGSVFIDGVEIAPENLAQWQRNLGYVPQQIYISDDSVTRNVAFGVPDEEIDMGAVREAARIANLAEFVERDLPLGYATVIGERGVRLSGGQRQRIGIARALYRNPAVLVMDEATSALDGVTEEHVMDAVRSLSRKKTIVMIAHRLTTVRECDVIHLLDRGVVVASGSYEELCRESHWFRTASGN